MSNCDSCKHSDFSDKSVKTGICKRYPPESHVFLAPDRFGSPVVQTVMIQPNVRTDQTCGEYVTALKLIS